MRRVLFGGGLLALWIGATAFAAERVNDVHFHHFHINAIAPDQSVAFYRDMLGGVPTRFGGRVDAVFTERSFIFFNKVTRPAPADLTTGLWHVGWGGVDGPREYNTLTGKGMRFQTPVSPLGNNTYMYPYGPDNEVLEIWSGYQNHRFGHVHLVSANPVATVRWYAKTFGIGIRAATPPAGTATNPNEPYIAEPNATSAGSGALLPVDNVNFVVFRQPTAAPVPPLWAGNAPITTINPTKGHALDHIAFSYRKIQPVFNRMKKAGITIAEPITVKPEGFKSFFITGPDSVSIEIVEAKPIPDAGWE